LTTSATNDGSYKNLLSLLKHNILRRGSSSIPKQPNSLPCRPRPISASIIKSKIFNRSGITLKLVHLFNILLQLVVDKVPQTPYRGITPGPQWGTSVSQSHRCLDSIPHFLKFLDRLLSHSLSSQKRTFASSSVFVTNLTVGNKNLWFGSILP